MFFRLINTNLVLCKNQAMEKSVLYFLLFLVIFTGNVRLNAQGGILDSDFDGDGKLNALIAGGSTTSHGLGVAIMEGANPNIVIIAQTNPNIQGVVDGAIMTYLPDGNLDEDLIYLNTFDYKTCITSLPNGPMLVAGYNTFDGNIIWQKLTPGLSQSDTASTSFSSTNPGDYYTILCMALASDSTVILAGGWHPTQSFGNDFMISRHKYRHTIGSNGLDLSFSFDGFVTTSMGSGIGSVATGVGVQADNKIIACGLTFGGTNSDVCLARYNTDGTLDLGFGTNGKVIDDIQGDDAANALLILPDGKVVIAGSTTIQGNSGTLLIRYNSNGTRDNTFGTNGVVTLVYGQWNNARAFTRQVDGKLIITGTCLATDSTETDFMVIRLNTDGTPDNTFGTNGVVLTDFFGQNDEGAAVAIQPDNRIVVTGMCKDANDNPKIAIARYLPGMVIGLIEFSHDNIHPLIYPNPLQATETLKYTLTSDENITVNLIDSQGKLVAEFIKNEVRTKGEHTEVLTLPSTLANGTYFIEIASPKGKVAIKVIK